MTTKFLQALAKLKPTSTAEVLAQRRNAKSGYHGAVAFEEDVYLKRRTGTVMKTFKPRVSEH